MTNKPKRYLRIVYALLIGASASLGALFSPLYLLMPAFLAFVGTAWGGGCFVLALAASVVCPLAINGFALETAYGLALFIPASIAIGSGLRSHRPHRSGVVAAVILNALALYCWLCLPSLLGGKPPFDGVRTVFDQFAEYFEAMVAAMPAEYALGSAAMSYLADIRDILPEMTTGFIVGAAMLSGFGNYMVSWALSRAAGADLRRMARFSEWQLSRGYTFGMLILIIGAVVMRLIRLENASAVLMAVECIVLFTLALMGLCNIEFILSRRPGGAAVRRLITYLVLALLLPYSLFILAALGMVDRLFKLRRRTLKAG